MKVTNKDLYIYSQNLNSLMDKVSGKIGYIVSYNLRKIIEELREYEDIRDKTINKFGSVNEETQQFSIKVGSDAYKEYLKEMKPYEDIEHEINFLKINPKDLYDSNLTGKEMLAISFMINDGEPSEKQGEEKK